MGTTACCLLADVHFFYGIGAATEGVDDEEDVAHIYVDAALEGRVELEVAGERFDIAVEGKADELALGVEHGGAGVAAREDRKSTRLNSSHSLNRKSVV